MTPSIVRIAKPYDAPEIWRLFLQAHHENGLFTIAPYKATHLMDRALHPERIQPYDTGVRAQIGVIGPLGRLEAVVFILISSFWYSDDLHLEELLVYVDPECRVSRHAQACLDWMKGLADSLQIPLLTGILSTEKTEAKIRLYDRKLPRVGAFYFYPLDVAKIELVRPQNVMNGPKDPRKLRRAA
jgi:hypothetical protein